MITHRSPTRGERPRWGRIIGLPGLQIHFGRGRNGLKIAMAPQTDETILRQTSLTTERPWFYFGGKNIRPQPWVFVASEPLLVIRWEAYPLFNFTKSGVYLGRLWINWGRHGV